MRLQKYLANAGVDSRRTCEQYIEQGRVTINGVVAVLGDKVAENDKIEFDGQQIFLGEKKRYIMLNKPIGVVTTAKDEKGRKTVIDCLDAICERIYPVGRLDINTSGLIILTNDGELANCIMHPSNQVPKCYEVIIEGNVANEDLDKLRHGIMLQDGMTMPCYVDVVGNVRWNTVVNITISEGRNRQVRRMVEAIEHRVVDLARIKVGSIEIKDLGVGEYRDLTTEEIAALYKECGLKQTI